MSGSGRNGAALDGSSQPRGFHGGTFKEQACCPLSLWILSLPGGRELMRKIATLASVAFMGVASMALDAQAGWRRGHAPDGATIAAGISASPAVRLSPPRPGPPMRRRSVTSRIHATSTHRCITSGRAGTGAIRRAPASLLSRGVPSTPVLSTGIRVPPASRLPRPLCGSSPSGVSAVPG